MVIALTLLTFAGDEEVVAFPGGVLGVLSPVDDER